MRKSVVATSQKMSTNAFGLVCLLVTLSLIGSDAVGRLCYSCDGVNCQRSTKLNQTVQCGDSLDPCVTVFDKFTVAARGCYSDMAVALRARCEQKDNIECQKCFGQLCNDRARADQKCITCSSNVDPKCAVDTSGMAATQCQIPTALLSYCYVRNNVGGSISRGCYVHPREQLECQQDAGCSLCLQGGADACNSYTFSVQSSGDRLLQLPHGLLAAIIAIAYKFIS